MAHTTNGVAKRCAPPLLWQNLCRVLVYSKHVDPIKTPRGALRRIFFGLLIKLLPAGNCESGTQLSH